MHGTLPAGPDGPRSPIPLALRLALRDLRAGLAGFIVFIACIALGVGAIAGVTSVSRSLIGGLDSQGRLILGGDMSFSLVQREARPAEVGVLSAHGAVSSIATLRAMANAGDKGVALVEVKAVDAAYPAVGAVAMEPADSLANDLAERDGAYGAVADPALFDRLDLRPGDRVRIGDADIVLAARLLSEPDKIAGGLGFGPRLIMSQAALRATGLLQPGSLVRWTYRLSLPSRRSDEAAIAGISSAVLRALPDAGWDVRTRLNAEPRFTENIDRFTQFLTLVGLTALLVGGVGVANAVIAFVDRKRVSLGILKSLGATGGRVVAICLTQIMLIAAIGIVLGLMIGAALPFATSAALASILPIPIAPTVAFGDLALAALYGILTALAFSLVPLGRAHDIPVSGLFRDRVAPDPRRARWVYVAAAAVTGVTLVGTAIAASHDKRIALIFAGVALCAFVLLRGLAAALIWGARRAPHIRRPFIRLAVANLHRPGALTPSLVLSLGLGIALLVTLAVVDGNLTRELTRSLPQRAPNFFFIDVPSAQAADFRAFLTGEAPGSTVEEVPMMRGRIVQLGDRPAAEVKPDGDSAWVLEGDRGITYSAGVPEGSVVTEGAWWPADYRGPPLVSFDARIAAGLGVRLGDGITVNVLGRTITANVANLRRIDWRRLGISFVMVFSPNAFAGAPHTQLSTLTLAPGADTAVEPRLMRALATRFPSITSVRVKDALDAVNAIVAELVFAIRIASSVALAASLLVLAGALAAGHRARVYDAVILKTLGATRWRLLGAYLVEYGILGVATAVFGLIAGTIAAYVVVTQVMRIGFTFSLVGAVTSAAATVVVALVLGLLGTWRILGQKPARHLRSL